MACLGAVAAIAKSLRSAPQPVGGKSNGSNSAHPDIPEAVTLLLRSLLVFLLGNGLLFCQELQQRTIEHL